MKPLLQNRALLTLAIAEIVSGLGSWVTTMAIFALVVFRNGGGVAQSGGIFLAALLPMLLFSPAAGWLSDHIDRRALLVGCQLFSALVVSGMIFTDSLALIYALLALQSCAVATFAPARQATVPALVDRAELTRANALLQQLAGIVKIGGPIAAGAILAVVNPHTAIVIDVISFLIAAAILSRLPALRPVAPPVAEAAAAESQGAPSASASGLRTLYIIGFAAVLVIMGFDVFSALIVRDVLAGSETIFGLMIGLVGLGTVAASLWLMLRGKPRSPWSDLALGLLLIAALPAALAGAIWIGSPDLGRTVVLTSALVGGVGNGLLIIQAGTLVQTLAPAGRVGRAGATLQSALVAGQLIALIGVPLLVPAIVPTGTYFAWSALALMMMAALVALRTRPGARATPLAAV